MIRKAQSLVGVSIMVLLFVSFAACSTSASTDGMVRQGSSTIVTSSPTSQPISSMMIPAHPTVAPPPPTATPMPTPMPTAKSSTGSQGTGSGTGTGSQGSGSGTGTGSQGTGSGTGTGSQGTGSGMGTSAEQQAAQAVFALINQERAGQGLPALIWSTKLVSSAHTHNLAMVAANKLSHQLPGELDFGTRITNAGLIWSSAAENIGYSSAGNPTSAAVGLNQSMFAEKPPDDGHRANILSGNTLVGIDVVQNPQNQQIWLTEDFAKPL